MSSAMSHLLALVETTEDLSELTRTCEDTALLRSLTVTDHA
jgi:hypothetical protein